MKKIIVIGAVFLLVSLLLAAGGNWLYQRWKAPENKIIRVNLAHELGEVLDQYNGIPVYFNDHVGNVLGRNLSRDKYNIGLKYQCVEFVKRYYYEKLGHKMPNSYGHAKDFFNPVLKDGTYNEERDMLQFLNGSTRPPVAEDLIVFGPTSFNAYGHVAIISRVGENEIEIIQQNPGPYGKSRQTFPLIHKDGKWHVGEGRVLGWLRLKAEQED